MIISPEIDSKLPTNTAIGIALLSDQIVAVATDANNHEKFSDLSGILLFCSCNIIQQDEHF